ncbi:MAG: PD-(D/E)XK nuclease family protein [Clostridiales Family XIII bacterium]|jgi:hypothetical protein|nr:PD-(D/E)XK nuclease family protein [Clostridiales Family XIII bacterium]
MSFSEKYTRDLLDKVNLIHNEFEAIYRANGSKFNIFSIAAIETKEIVICNVIAELLNPNGRHCQGDIFLRIFVKGVLGIDSFDYNDVKVMTEYPIKDNRRIDILITSKKNIIPIEVKIYAEDGKNQCYDYHEYFNEDRRFNKLYYLTLDGNAPSEYSASELAPIYEENIDFDDRRIVGYEGVEAISFKENIIDWLEACIRLPGVVNISPIREIISQLIDTLKILTDQLEENMETKVKAIIIEQEEYLKCAHDITVAFGEIKKDAIAKVFNQLDAYISETYNLIRIENKYDYQRKNYKSYSGITYHLGFVYPNAEQNNLHLWFRVEMDSCGYLLLGFYTGLKDGESSKDRVSLIDKQLTPKLKIPNRNSSDAWYHWEWFDDADDATPNFKEPNTAFFEFAKEDSSNKFLKDAEMKIDKVLGYYSDIEKLKK